MLAALADISVLELALIAVAASLTAIIGGVAGYGAGALMPLVLVPILGADPVVPIVALASLFTNASRALAFVSVIDRRRAGIVLAASVPTCVIGAYGYSLLTAKGALIVIGAMMIVSVPLRRILVGRGYKCSDTGLAVGAAGWGIVVGGSTGAGIILLSLLIAAGVQGGAVIATDAVVSIIIGIVKVGVFGVAGILDAKVIAVALLMGVVAIPGSYFAKRIVDRLSLKAHMAILDAVVVIGGIVMLVGAFK